MRIDALRCNNSTLHPCKPSAFTLRFGVLTLIALALLTLLLRARLVAALGLSAFRRLVTLGLGLYNAVRWWRHRAGCRERIGWAVANRRGKLRCGLSGGYHAHCYLGLSATWKATDLEPTKWLRWHCTGCACIESELRLSGGSLGKALHRRLAGCEPSCSLGSGGMKCWLRLLRVCILHGGSVVVSWMHDQ